MKKLVFISGLFSVFATTAVFAEQPSFNLIEGGYSHYSLDDEDGDGFIIRGSVELTDNIYLQGEASEITIDNALENALPNDDLDLSYQTFGVGFKTGINDNTAVFGSVNYLNSEADLLGNSNSEDGYTLSAGVRSMITDSTELYGEITHIELDGSATELKVGARQYLTENVGVFAEYAKMDNGDQDNYNVGISYRF